MLRRYQQFWIIPVALMLAMPLIATVVAQDSTSNSRQEARQLAPVPSWPKSLDGWLALPRQIDAYLNDHFGLRQTFICAYNRLLDQAVFRSGNNQVLLGSHGWMFLRADAMLAQSAGSLRRDGQIAEAAELIAAMQNRLASDGRQLLVALPPNSASIYTRELPLWAQNPGRRTEYDVLLDNLAAHGIKTVDLRPVLRAATVQGKIYRMHDTHWTARGAVAAFNAIVDADSHPDWKLDPASVLGRPEIVQGGDLARLVGMNERVSELEWPLALPEGKRDQFSTEPISTYMEATGHVGPTIMIMGDSFTHQFFPPMLAQHAGHIVWVHHQFCGFDWKWIDQLHPDEVWWMPTERYMLCASGHWPTGLVRPSLAER